MANTLLGCLFIYSFAESLCVCARATSVRSVCTLVYAMRWRPSCGSARLCFCHWIVWFSLAYISTSLVLYKMETTVYAFMVVNSSLQYTHTRSAGTYIAVCEVRFSTNGFCSQTMPLGVLLSLAQQHFRAQLKKKRVP